jgi:Mn2+/Fe2+ NRAMP family transporter
MDFVNPDVKALTKGWAYGFADVDSSDIFSVAGILGSVVMPHNLYLHTAAVQNKSQQIKQSPDVINSAVHYCSLEPILPIIISFFVNMAVVTIAAESVYGKTENAELVGLTDFCFYFQSLKGGCLLWAIALLAAGQSGAITTTFTGQYVMDGFLNLQIPIALRSIVTRLLAIVPGVIVSVLFPDRLNHLVNVVNALLGLLLPFAFTPLVKYNCSKRIMGENASKGFEKGMLYAFAVVVWGINATTISAEGGGFFGDIRPSMAMSVEKVMLILTEVLLQLFYAYWNVMTLFGSDSYDVIEHDIIEQQASSDDGEGELTGEGHNNEFELT